MAKGDNLKGIGRPKTGGRPKGTPNKITQVINEIMTSEELLRRIDTGEVLGPLAKMFLIMNDTTLDAKIQLEAAKALATYTNRKMPTETQTTITTGNEQLFEIKFVKPAE